MAIPSTKRAPENHRNALDGDFVALVVTKSVEMECKLVLTRILFHEANILLVMHYCFLN